MRAIFRFVLLLAVVALFGLTIETVRVRSVRSADRSAMRIGGEDVVRRVKTASANLFTVTELNNRTALAKARAFARIVASDPSVVDSQERFAALCKPLDVEELHVSDEKGVLIRSVPTVYCGYDMNSSEQSRPFMKAIADKSFEMVQEPTLKGSDGTLFQYAGVARIDKPGILQVGWSADRVREARMLADVEALAESTRIGQNGRVKISRRRSPVSNRDEAVICEKTVDGVRTYVLTSLVDAYVIDIVMPVYGSWLSDDGPFAVLCIIDFLIVLLLVLMQLSSMRGLLTRNFQSLKMLFDGALGAGGGGFAAKSRLVRWLNGPVALVCVVSFCGAAAVCWILASRSASANARVALLKAADTMRKEIESCVDQQLFYQGHTLCEHFKAPERVSAADVTNIVQRMGMDELNVVDSRGVVIASNFSFQRGYDMGLNPISADFNRLLKGATSVSHPFRESISAPGTRYKYVGVAFPPPAKGYLQIGFMDERIKSELDYWFAEVARDRHVARNGFYVIAKTETSEIDSCGKIDRSGRPLYRTGDTLVSIGFDVSAAPKDPNEFFTASLYGEPCLCLTEVRNFHRCITAIPLAEISSEARSTAVMTMAILFLVFVVVAVFMTRLSGLVASLKSYIADAARRQSEDMEMAKNIQFNVLPSHFPPYPTLADRIDIFARMITAKEVGGDFYDFYFIKHSKLALVVADVSGKGVPAALFMMRAKATLQGMLKSCLDVEQAVRDANDRLCEGNDSNMFVTAWVGVVDIDTGEMEYVNAGHNPPLMKHRDRQVDFLTERSGPPLAAMPGSTYRKKTLRLGKADGLVLYTDGVTEATNPHLDLFGEHRLVSAMKDLVGVRDAQRIVDGIVDCVHEFAEGSEQADDITLLAFKLK